VRLPTSRRRRAFVIVALHVAAMSAAFALSVWLVLRRSFILSG